MRLIFIEYAPAPNCVRGVSRCKRCGRCGRDFEKLAAEAQRRFEEELRKIEAEEQSRKG
jgi:hypothetical protein